MIKQSLPIAISVALVFLSLSLFLMDRFGRSGEEGDGVVRVYYADNISGAHQRVIERFNQLHRGRKQIIERPDPLLVQGNFLPGPQSHGRISEYK